MAQPRADERVRPEAATRVGAAASTDSLLPRMVEGESAAAGIERVEPDNSPNHRPTRTEPMSTLSNQAPRPRRKARRPSYPRNRSPIALGAVALGAVALLAACSSEVNVEDGDGGGGFGAGPQGTVAGAYGPGGSGGTGWGGNPAGEVAAGFGPGGAGGVGGEAGAGGGVVGWGGATGGIAPYPYGGGGVGGT